MVIALLSFFQEWYLSIVKDQCFNPTPNARECALMLQRLEYSDILTIIMTKVTLV